jgi:hypothetical protein
MYSISFLSGKKMENLASNMKGNVDSSDVAILEVPLVWFYIRNIFLITHLPLQFISHQLLCSPQKQFQ